MEQPRLVRFAASACLGVGLVLAGNAATAVADSPDNDGTGNSSAQRDSNASPGNGSGGNPGNSGTGKPDNLASPNSGNTKPGGSSKPVSGPGSGAGSSSAAGGTEKSAPGSPGNSGNVGTPETSAPTGSAAADSKPNGAANSGMNNGTNNGTNIGNGPSNGGAGAANGVGNSGTRTVPNLPEQASPVAKAAMDAADASGDLGSSASSAPVQSVATPASPTTEAPVAASSGSSDFGPADLISLIWTSLVNAANTSTNPANKSPVTPMAVAAPTALLGAGMLSVPLTLEPELTPAPPADAMTPLLLSSANATTDGPERLSGGGWLAYLATQISLGVREALRNVSVTELALAALPGLVGLLFFFASGVGLGRRQARFGFALQSTGAIRFAARGPLGVVRSGTMVSVRVRGASDTTRPRLALKAVSTAA